MSGVFDLEDKIVDDVLDLSSFCHMSEASVEKIALYNRVTKIDLSSNEILKLPPNFVQSLHHVTHLDLSINKLRELPNNFGALSNLKHLDLSVNKLTDLPLSFSNLKSLTYLNLSDNPLRLDLSIQAGSCLSLIDCQRAAKKVVAHLENLKRKKDYEYSKQAIEDREKMAKQLPEVREKDKKRTDKKAGGKEKQKQESDESKRKQHEQRPHHLVQQREQSSSSSSSSEYLNGKSSKKLVSGNKNRNSKTGISGNNRWSWLGLINIFLLCSVFASAATCLVLYTDGDLSREGIKSSWPRFVENTKFLQNTVLESVYYEKLRSNTITVWSYVGPYFIKIQETLILGLGAAGNLISTSIQGLEPITGDLSHYYKDFGKSLRSMDDYLKYFFVFITEGVLWFYGFILDQFLVLKEEFWRNEAVFALWKDLKPVRHFIWSNTETLRSFYWQLHNEVGHIWVPYGKTLARDIFLYSREQLGTLFV